MRENSTLLALTAMTICFSMAALFFYKNFICSKTGKLLAVEEKVEVEKEIPEEGVVLPIGRETAIKDEEVVPEKEVVLPKEEVEEIHTVAKEVEAILQQIGAEIREIVLKLKNITRLKETSMSTTTETTEGKPVADEISRKQKAAKPEQPSAAEEKIRNLIAEIKEERAAAGAEEQLMQEINGLIIEETMTKIGYEFYEYFFLLWEPPQVALKSYNILITERASPTWGSLVEIKIRENTVWSRVLRPRSEEIEEAVKQAVEATKYYLQNYGKR